jgi:hypothetical protein
MGATRTSRDCQPPPHDSTLTHDPLSSILSLRKYSTTLQGTLQISNSFTGSAQLPDSIKTLTGGIIGDSTGATSVLASNLQQLGTNPSTSSQSLSLQNSMLLTSVNLPQLTNIGGNMDFANNSQLAAINGF